MNLDVAMFVEAHDCVHDDAIYTGDKNPKRKKKKLQDTTHPKSRKKCCLLGGKLGNTKVNWSMLATCIKNKRIEIPAFCGLDFDYVLMMFLAQKKGQARSCTSTQPNLQGVLFEGVKTLIRHRHHVYV